MNPDLKTPEFPCSLEPLAEPGMFDSLSNPELAAFYRLILAAWRQDPPCTLPDEPAYLAAVARVSLTEWAALSPRLLLTLSVRRDQPVGRLLLSAAQRVYLNLSQGAAEISRKASASARARWAAKAGPPDAVASERMRPHASASTAPTVRSESLSSTLNPALPLQRSIPPDEFLRSARAPGREVIAQLGERARAIGQEDLRNWRRSRSVEMLQTAFATWKAAGVTTAPMSKASELADGPDSSPARVDYLIEEANAQLARAAAAKSTFNPVGFLISRLGLGGRGFGRPVDVPLWVEKRWAKTEGEQMKLLNAAASIRALQLFQVQPQAGSIRAASQGA